MAGGRMALRVSKAGQRSSQSGLSRIQGLSRSGSIFASPTVSRSASLGGGPLLLAGRASKDSGPRLSLSRQFLPCQGNKKPRSQHSVSGAIPYLGSRSPLAKLAM